MDIHELSGKIRYVKIVLLIRRLRSSSRHLEWLSGLLSESHRLRGLHNISPDETTFESLRCDLPRMKFMLSQALREEAKRLTVAASSKTV